ncbi:PAS domain S-box protein [Scytonema millei]|uniref:AAA family ATPase n=1 Tax=Scytonema millei VB511283 TaxID=1245923 RepID=A0A9X5EBH3_9CYAN|nr:PAS domain S-box protein [Scytonema millei]NHC37347.1 AAA family ATPase [Scytonema millei VB511283]
MIALPGVAILSKIYESSASLVYRGIREQDERAIVVKLLKQNYPSPQELTRYKQEYEITHSLSIDGVVKAYSQQDYQRTLVILLEDFGGESLERLRQQQSDFYPMPSANFLRLAIAITDILGKIHAANIIHKDINPSNIVLNLDTGVVKMIDFGIATRFSRTNPTFKSLHLLEGTLAYLSPEQTGRMNRMLDYRSDFYSLGATFYKLLTGQLPFPTSDILELVHCHIAKQPVPPHELNSTIPKPVSDIILKLMAKNAEDRYQSAWGIKADLERCDRQLAQIGQINSFQLGRQDVSEQFQIPQKLYGREGEIEALLAAFDRVAARENAENSPQFNVEMMLVSGYAGIGKSALVQELYKPITAKHGYFIWGKFDSFERNIPYSAIVDALQKLVQQLLGEPDEQLQQWRSHLLAALGSNGQIIIDAIPEVELIIGKRPPVPEVGATEAQNRFNLTFQKFVRVFCDKEHPLVIFLDDLQWIDSATLKLIELILLDEQTQYLFLIGAYRDHEVTSTHPLILTLEKLRKQGAVLQEIILAPLTPDPLSQLIAETLHHNVDTVRPLTQLVLRKTEGNPFFSCEFLRMLYSENLLTFDADRLCWQWDIAQIETQDITDNVVELLLLQLKNLPQETQQILRLAACIGAEFDLDTLALVCEKSPPAISLDLLAAIQAGLIQPLSELDENLLVQEYKFSHDRVQQAAYALIDESQKQVVHLQIGRNLLEKTSAEQQSERLFEIVDHLNRGIELVSDRAKRTEIAFLNLIAGQKAKAAIAYSMAQNYLATAREWLAASSWQTNYQLALDLSLETTEVAYLCGNFEQVEYWTPIVIQEAKTILDIIKVYEVKIQTYIAQNQPLKAIDTALQVLQQLGIDFPKKPTQSDIQLELDVILSLLSGKAIEGLIHLPQMTEPEKLTAMRILSRITVAAWIAAPDLMPLLVSKQVNLSIQYGNALVSPFAYALHGLILCGIVGNIESGYQFGQLALKLLSQSNLHSLRARTLFVVNISIIHWKEYLRKISKPLLEGYQSGLETGDLEFAAYCAQGYCTHSFFMGKELAEVEGNIATYSEAIRQIKQEVALTWIQIFQQTIANLMGRSSDPYRLVGKFYNEENGLPQHQAANDGTAIFCVYFSKLFLYYLFSENARAVEYADIAESYSSCVTAATIFVLYYLYNSLARLGTYFESSDRAQSEILEQVAHSQEKMKQWAHYAPMNYLHKYDLVEAEKARVLGQFFEAEEFYERAIAGAAENEFIQEEALAYELAAKHYLMRGREKFAQTYMKEAHYCYNRWGAKAKVKDLENRYPQFFSQLSKVTLTSVSTTSETSSSRSDIALDLAAIMKASQAIAREIELEHLLRLLMQILIQNAGAQTGYLILENSGGWVIEATGQLNDGDGENVYITQVLQSVPIIDRLPEAIINYVIRTHESVILNEAIGEGAFINESYIQRNQTKSIFCLPLLNQAKLVGILYLENKLAVGAFTTERTQVLNLLSTQTAIAIENAFLYSKLRKSESKIAQFLEAVPVGIAIVDATGRPYYANQRGIQLMGKGTDPSVAQEQISAVYQFYEAETDRIYPTEKLPTIRALKGERTRSEDLEIRQNNTTIPVEAWGTPVYDEQGNITHAIAAFQDITQRKQAEKLLADYNRTLEQQVAQRTAALQASEAALRDREQELRLITDALPVYISYVDADRRYRFVNRAYEVWFKRSRDEILGKHVREIVSEAAYQIAEPYINQVLGGQSTTFEAEIPPGSKNYISATHIPDFSANGQVQGYYGLIRDISDCKLAEAALQRSEAKFRNIFENSQVGIYRTRLSDGLILEANQRLADLFGFDSPDEMIGLEHTVNYYVNLSDRSSAIELLTRDGTIQSFEVQMRKRDGTPFWALYSSRLNDECVEGVVADISEQQAALRERKQAEEALQASETKLRTLIEAIPDPLFVLTAEGRFLEIIVQEPNLLWQPIEEMIGQTMHQLGKEQADEFLSYIQQVLGTQQILTVEYSTFLNGREAWFSARIAPIDRDRVIWLTRDITALKQAEAASILEERNRMAREIHDTLAQAFTGILAQVGAAKQVLTDDLEAAQAHLDLIKELARTGLTEARRSVVALRPQLLESGSLQSALHRLVAQTRAAATDTTLYYEIEGAVYSLPTEVENNLLRIGQEALTNAIRHANADEIRVKLVYDLERFCLRVKDNGQGFGVGSIPCSEGFGLLGMSERAERIDAQLTIRSQPGQGTEIIVTVNPWVAR